MNSKHIKAIIPLAIGLVVLLLPAPEGLPIVAWRYLALFLAVIAGLILEPVSPALIGVMGVVTGAILKMGAPIPKSGIVSSGAAINWALSGFANSTIWLIFAAFMMAMGYEKTGLGRRVSLILVRSLGRTSIGLGYATIFAEILIAPFTPSNSARNGGILFPIIRNIPLVYDSRPDHQPRKVGAYIVWMSMISTCVSSSIFYSACAPNMLAGSIMSTQGVNITWMQWFWGFLPVGIILTLVSPLLLYIVYPPEMKRADEAPAWAAEQLREMGPLSIKEKLMALFATLALVLWIGANQFGINPTTSAMLVLCLITLFKIVEWKDIVSHTAAWNMFFWLGSLVTMADGLKNVGFLSWFAQKSAAAFTGYPPMTILLGLICVFYVSHYFFASMTAHVTALYALFLTTILAVPGLDPTKSALMLGYTIGLFGILTPYGTGPSPIWYGLGYITTARFWGLGAIFGAFFLAVLLLVGLPWINWITL